jgi:hypothetical protein
MRAWTWCRWWTRGWATAPTWSTWRCGALVVDPGRDPRPYLIKLHRRGLAARFGRGDGALADAYTIATAIVVVAAITTASGIDVAIRMQETTREET